MRSLAVILLLSASATAADAPAVSRLPTAADAQVLADEDLGRLDRVDRFFTRYIWIPDPAKALDAKAMSLVLNLVSRSTVISRPEVFGKQTLLMRIDIRRFAPRSDKNNDLQEWIDTWEELRFDPAFNRLITSDTIKNVIKNGAVFDNVIEIGSGRILVKSKPYKIDGETFESKWVNTIRIPAEHLDLKLSLGLEDQTSSEAPVVHYQYALTRMLTSIKGKGVFKDVWGGLYYDFNGIKTAKQAGRKGITDEGLLFETLGSDADAEKFFDKLRSDQRGALLRSGVTGKKRRWDVVPVASVRPGAAQAILSVTHDIQDDDVDAEQDVFMNLLKFTDRAREDLWVGTNGLQRGALFNGGGALQQAAPSNVVKDHTVRPPFTADLQAGISCIRCHMATGDDGWKPLPNDVPKLAKFGADIKGDLGDLRKGKPTEETIDRLAGLYAGSADKVLRRAREDQIEAALRATGPWPGGKGDQTDVLQLAATRISDIYAGYNYDMIDAEVALAEMGYKVDKKLAVEVFRNLLPPDLQSDVGGVILEDYRVAALRAGLAIDRPSWSLVQAFATARARKAEKK